jgi:hypothetical protein
MQAASFKTPIDFSVKMEAEGVSEMLVDYNMMEVVDASERLVNCNCRRRFSSNTEKKKVF